MKRKNEDNLEKSLDSIEEHQVKQIKSQDKAESSDQEIHLYGENFPTRYDESFNQFMAGVIVESSKIPKYNFDNVGWNLIFFMKQCMELSDLERNYEKECIEIRKSYKALTDRVEKIKKTTSEKTLELPNNQFIRSIDTFLKAVLDATDTHKILSEKSISYKSILDVSVCHDCLTQTYDILSEEVFTLGDVSDI